MGLVGCSEGGPGSGQSNSTAPSRARVGPGAVRTPRQIRAPLGLRGRVSGGLGA